MKISLRRLAVILFIILGLSNQFVLAQGNNAETNGLEFEYGAGTFSFRLLNKLEDKDGSWVLQRSADMRNWQDLETFKGNKTITVPIQRGVRHQYYRAHQTDGGDSYLSDYIDSYKIWQESGVDSYSMEIRHWSSWFFWHGNVIVRNNEVISSEVIDTNFPDDFDSEQRTIHDWFEVLKRNIDNKAYRIDVTYDKTFGYPKSAFIDVELWLADEEQGWDILKFSPMRQFD